MGRVLVCFLVTVSCTAHIASSYFSPRFAEVTEYYKTHDFTTSGLGQRIYDYALVLAGDKKGTPDVLPDSVLWLPGEKGGEEWEPQGGPLCAHRVDARFHRDRR